MSQTIPMVLIYLIKLVNLLAYLQVKKIIHHSFTSITLFLIPKDLINFINQFISLLINFMNPTIILNLIKRFLNYLKNRKIITSIHLLF
jgi:hypothetical protein